MRGYTFEIDLDYDDDGEPTLKSKIREEMVQNLASEWNVINRRIEERSWRSRDERLDEDDYHSEMAAENGYDAVSQAEEANPNLSEEEKNKIKQDAIDAYYKQVQAQENEIYLRRDVIEELLADLGARMMRPYEHWNEDERYMEYMENRYDDAEYDY